MALALLRGGPPPPIGAAAPPRGSGSVESTDTVRIRLISGTGSMAPRGGRR
jgi:hypothetical protein